MKLSLYLLTFSSCLTCGLHAQTLLLDFGPSATDAPTLSPGHANETIGNTWNTVGKADITSGLLTDAGLAATGVGLNIGMGDGSSNAYEFDFDDHPNRDNLTGTQRTAGVYAGSAPAKDGIFQNSPHDMIGIQLTGLTAGEYRIYLTGQNTNVGADPAAFFVAQGTAATIFDFGTPGTILSMTNNGQTAAWIAGENYNMASILLTTGNALYIGVDGASGGGDQRSFLTSIEVVAIPEPASYALLSACFAFAAVALRRRGA